ncbi:hypothetical protein K435DRAFT_787201 [Dendrothele bispora CBS 962.96]|uniref:Extracellular membrane protein CFEM domain-containing protein n=1 Tax=Dendrothele bispora (strain CBS 962.96) TaxID=1314807 RepID=A0A4S8KLP5_DENBC|nr:hypothetical protein K435DRAFT_787201 [Dendrothele bispora CBS 962.96]
MISTTFMTLCVLSLSVTARVVNQNAIARALLVRQNSDLPSVPAQCDGSCGDISATLSNCATSSDATCGCSAADIDEFRSCLRCITDQDSSLADTASTDLDAYVNKCNQAGASLTSFVPSATITSPTGATSIDDHGNHSEPGDDRGNHSEPGDDDRGNHSEPGDDRGNHSEPGDDRGNHSEPGDDRGNHSANITGVATGTLVSITGVATGTPASVTGTLSSSTPQSTGATGDQSNISGDTGSASSIKATSLYGVIAVALLVNLA